MKKSLQAGFTLIELIVVVMIIGILSATMLTVFTGAGESAKATRCKNNIRALTTAMISCATQNENGHYPAAGNFKYTTYDGKLIYHDRWGWVSRRPFGAKQVGEFINFHDEDNFKDKEATTGLRYALTAGALWAHVGGSREVYLCPVHAEACQKKHHRQPGWSFVVNSRFAWAHDGKTALPGWEGVSHGSFGSAAERVLMFAEIQGVTDEKYDLEENTSGTGELGDSVLQYSGSSTNGKSTGNEVIGFNHKLRKQGYVGHVSFCDGHVDQYVVPKKKGGLSAKEVTKRLCEGTEIHFDGLKYNE